MRPVFLPIGVRHHASRLDADALFSRLEVTVTPPVPYTLPHAGLAHADAAHTDLPAARHTDAFTILHIPADIIALLAGLMPREQPLNTNTLLTLLCGIFCGDEEYSGFGAGARRSEAGILGIVLDQCARWDLPIFRAHLDPTRPLALLFAEHYLGTRTEGVNMTLRPYPGAPLESWALLVNTVAAQATREEHGYPLRLPSNHNAAPPR